MILKKGLAIAGFMGSGKTTLGQDFALQVQAPFFDLDQLVEQASQMSIAQMFLEKGESYFRSSEFECLHNLHQQSLKPYVLSLGGGTPFLKGVSSILESYVVIWFRFSWEFISERLFQNAIQMSQNRPLLGTFSETKKLYDDREVLFQEMYGDWTQESLKQVKSEHVPPILKPKTMWCVEHLFDSTGLYKKLLFLWRSIFKSQP